MPPLESIKNLRFRQFKEYSGIRKLPVLSFFLIFQNQRTTGSSSLANLNSKNCQSLLFQPPKKSSKKSSFWAFMDGMKLSPTLSASFYLSSGPFFSFFFILHFFFLLGLFCPFTFFFLLRIVFFNHVFFWPHP